MMRWITSLLLLYALVVDVRPAQAQDIWGLVDEMLAQVSNQAKKFPQVYRIQIRLQTSKTKNAGTDNWVRVQLNPQVQTYLDLPGDDFERGAIQTYDLMLTDNNFKNSFKRLEDIQYLTIQNTGKSADWAIDSFQLLVNGRIVYEERFPRPRWLGTYTVPGEALRAAAGWRTWKWELPSLRFSRQELEQRTASFLGHFLHESPQLRGIRWGDNGSGVRMARVSDDTLRVHFDLAKVITGPDPDFNIDLDIRFSQLKDRLEIRVVEAQLTGDGAVAGIGKVLFPAKVREARDKVRQTLLNRSLISIPVTGIYFRVHANGDLELIYGEDPMARVRQAEAAESARRFLEEEERRRLERQRRGQAEP